MTREFSTWGHWKNLLKVHLRQKQWKYSLENVLWRPEFHNYDDFFQERPSRYNDKRKFPQFLWRLLLHYTTSPRRAKSKFLRNRDIWLVEMGLIMQLGYEYDAIKWRGFFQTLKACWEIIREWLGFRYGRKPLVKIQYGGIHVKAWKVFTKNGPFFCRIISLLYYRKDGWLWGRRWLGWSCSKLSFCVFFVIFIVFIHSNKIAVKGDPLLYKFSLVKSIRRKKRQWSGYTGVHAELCNEGFHHGTRYFQQY